MIIPKFKKADRVVVTSIRYEHESPMADYKGKAFTVERVEGNEIHVSEFISSYFFEDELTLETIIKSPLYQALK